MSKGNKEFLQSAILFLVVQYANKFSLFNQTEIIRKMNFNMYFKSANCLIPTFDLFLISLYLEVTLINCWKM